jgi:DNA-binding transcriptional LysR family regulator
VSLSSLQLDAFLTAAQKRSFSLAAKELHVTQSALTQRIANLESELGMRLFIRKPRGVEPTEAGLRLLRYCQTKQRLEEELLSTIGTPTDGGAVGGSVRIAGFSSIARSVLLPALGPLVHAHSGRELHLQSGELRELPQLLFSGEVDFVVLDQEVSRPELEIVLLGKELNVLAESTLVETPEDVYLDHDPHDPTTAKFLRAQTGHVPSFRRSFVDDIYGVLDGIALGLGRGVVPLHLVRGDARLRVAPDKRPIESPVLLHYYRSSGYTKLGRLVVDTLVKVCPELLERAAPPPAASNAGKTAAARKKSKLPKRVDQ